MALDKVLLKQDPRFAMIVKHVTSTNYGLRVECDYANPELGISGAYNETDLIPCPEDWQDAPLRPSCREGRFDGAPQNDQAYVAWFKAAMAWEQTHGKRIRRPR